MNQLENNVVESFRLVKNDIMELQKTIADISQNQKKIMDSIHKHAEKETKLYHTMKDLNTKLKKSKKQVKKVQNVIIQKPARKRTSYVASKLGKSFYKSNTAKARSIKRSNRLVFSSQAKALKAGFMPAA